jgi:SH3-like domain-containing protein
MLRLLTALAILAGAGITTPMPSMAQTASGATGLPVPRFVTIRANKVNMRTGPGVRYPIDWEYRRAGLPVEIVGEYGTWRKIRDWQGDEGWMHQSMLSGRRSVMIRGDVAPLRAEPNAAARMVARLEAGVIGRIAECQTGNSWCRVEVEGFEGWLERDRFWGVYQNEVIEP